MLGTFPTKHPLARFIDHFGIELLRLYTYIFVRSYNFRENRSDIHNLHLCCLTIVFYL